IEYRLGDEEFAAFEDPLSLDSEGEHVLDYRASDEAGNETAKSATVRIDASAPVTEATVAEPRARMSAVGPVTVTFDAVDEVSGIAGTQVRVDGGEWVGVEEIVLDRAGDYLIEFFSIDVAGNSEPTQSLEVTVTQAPGGGDVGADGPGDGGDA